MKASRFNSFLEDIPEKGSIMYNHLNHTGILIPPKIKDLFDSGTPELIRDTHPNAFNTLTKKGFLLETVRDETNLVKDLIYNFKHNRYYLNLVFILTRACNFNCSYCIQGSAKRNAALEPGTISKFMGILSRFEPDFQVINTTFYGGEPLLHPGSIRQIQDNLVTAFPDKKHNFSLITNGYLLDRYFESDLKGLIDQFTITLDGNRELHDSKRVTATGAGTYPQILSNLKLLPENSVILNVNLENFDYSSNIHQLLLDLHSPEIFRKIKEIHFKPVIQNGENCNYPGILTYSGYNFEYLIEYNKMALNMGFRIKDYLRIGPCLNHSPMSFVLDSNGSVFKCPAMIDHTQTAITHINMLDNFTEPETVTLPCENETCLNCKFLPECFGGCAYSAYLNYKDGNKVQCEKEYFNKFALIMKKYELKNKL